MTLTTHALIAAAVTQSFGRSHPVLGFAAAIASHYLSDAIPHWDYALNAGVEWKEKPKEDWTPDDFWQFRMRIRHDLIKIVADAVIGALAVAALTQPASPADWLWAGGVTVGGMLPDFLQGLHLSGIRILKPAQRFHDLWHTKIRLGPYPLVGIPFQVFIAAIAILFLL